MKILVLILVLVLQSKTRAQVDEADFDYSQADFEQGSGQELTGGSENDLIGSGDNLITGSGEEEDLRYLVSDMEREMLENESRENEDDESFEEEDSDEDDDSDEEEEEEEEKKECDNKLFGCCPNSELPAHGPKGEGCCLLSEFGCCPDNLRPAEGPEMKGCDCESSEFGCCPDNKITQRGPGGEGCGCVHSEHGCCQDQHTEALGPNHEGCPCFTFDYGCCEDGLTIAKGPNKDGCSGCQSSQFGCCEDGFTSAQGENMEGCGCAGSEYGCCPNGLTKATGLEFEGCQTKPGEACNIKQEKGKCEDFSVRWYFDLKEGRCSRFWYGGCEGNINRFNEAEECEETCVNPPGSGRCYLPKIKGICDGDYERFYYDHTYKQCVSFNYGGCLGNANRFSTKLECEQACVKSENIAICEQPQEPGPCLGNFSRWFYDEKTGECETFSYGGCHGNQNRFMTKEECDNSCMHKKVVLQTATICKQEIETGSCTESHPRWGFNEQLRTCVPFYYSGCDGNSNSFETQEECESRCPSAFPPELEVVSKILNVEEGSEAVLEITVEGNPFPEISWEKDSELIEISEKYKLREDRSLILVHVTMADAGSWTVIADNGLGKVARRQISLSVYPSQIPIQVEIPLENTTFPTGTNIRLECRVQGFPIPTLTWLKNNAKLPKSKRIYVEDERFLVINRASPIDGGLYICRARNEKMQNQAVVDITVLQGKVPIQCQDQPKLANCALIVRAKYCARNENFARICCQSCVNSGQIAGPPA